MASGMTWPPRPRDLRPAGPVCSQRWRTPAPAAIPARQSMRPTAAVASTRASILTASGRASARLSAQQQDGVARRMGRGLPIRGRRISRRHHQHLGYQLPAGNQHIRQYAESRLHPATDLASDQPEHLSDDFGHDEQRSDGCRQKHQPAPAPEPVECRHPAGDHSESGRRGFLCGQPGRVVARAAGLSQTRFRRLSTHRTACIRTPGRARRATTIMPITCC